jgi:hypothetical protein
VLVIDQPSQPANEPDNIAVIPAKAAASGRQRSILASR